MMTPKVINPQTCSFQMSASYVEKLNTLAKDKGISKSKLIRAVLTEFLDQTSETSNTLDFSKKYED